jgi:hypothetical protein
MCALATPNNGLSALMVKKLKMVAKDYPSLDDADEASESGAPLIQPSPSIFLFPTHLPYRDHTVADSLVASESEPPDDVVDAWDRVMITDENAAGYLYVSLTHLLTHCLTHSLTHSLSHSLSHSLTRSLTHSLAHSLTHSPTHPLTHSLAHSLTVSLTM